MNIYEKLKELDLTLPAPPAKGGVYTPVQEFGSNLLYCSGCASTVGAESVVGKVGVDLTLEEGQHAAYLCALNLLANLQEKLGDLNRIRRLVKMLGFVNCSDQFAFQPAVINGASNLFKALFGEEKGVPARSAIGTNALPGGVACEIELLVEID